MADSVRLALTAADFTLAVAIQNIVWGISQAPVGAVADRFGLRITMIAGAAIYVVLQDYISSMTQNWMSFIGLLFVMVVMFFPSGILGMLKRRATT